VWGWVCGGVTGAAPRCRACGVCVSVPPDGVPAGGRVRTSPRPPLHTEEAHNGNLEMAGVQPPHHPAHRPKAGEASPHPHDHFYARKSRVAPKLAKLEHARWRKGNVYLVGHLSPFFWGAKHLTFNLWKKTAF
jgi:hypothetical protein